METLRKQIAKAHRRLVFQQFAGALVWLLFAALLVATIAIGVSKLVAVPVEPNTWALAWMGGSLGAALLAAAAFTWWQRRSRLDAALEIDHRFGLKERVSSTLSMAPAELETPAGKALVDDAIRRVETINVAERFTFKADRRMLLPLVPAVAAFALAMFVDSKGRDNPVAATQQTSTTMQVKQSSQALQKKLAERSEEAKEKGLTDAENLFKKLEAGTKDLSQKKETDRKQALIELSDLADQLKQRREKIGGDEKFKQQLNQLKDMDHGPADDLAKAMKDGDLSKASKELDNLKKKLENEALDENERNQLAKQMDQMQQKLQKVAQAHQEAKDNLQQKLNEQRKAGNAAEGDKIQQQLDKLAQQEKKMGQLRKMADKLGEASQCMKQGQCKNAGDQLGQMAAELKEMAKDSEELAMLDDALEQIADAKDAMGCKECNGEGCKACQGGGKSNKWGKGGDGLGQAIGGKGDRPENKNNTGFYDSQVRQNVGKGTAVVTDLVDGPSRKGEVQEEIKTQFESAKREAEDPLNAQRLPRDYREHAKKYFDALREGQK